MDVTTKNMINELGQKLAVATDAAEIAILVAQIQALGNSLQK